MTSPLMIFLRLLNLICLITSPLLAAVFHSATTQTILFHDCLMSGFSLYAVTFACIVHKNTHAKYMTQTYGNKNILKNTF